MARIFLPDRLRGLTSQPWHDADGHAHVSDAICHLVQRDPRLKSYLFDDQGLFRETLVIYVDGREVTHAGALDARIEPGSDIHIMRRFGAPRGVGLRFADIVISH